MANISFDKYTCCLFDFESFFTENHSSALKYLHKASLLRFTAIGRSPKELQERSNQVMIDFYGKGNTELSNQPKLLQDWVLAKLTNTECLEMYKDAITKIKNSNHTKELLNDVGKLTFTPEILSNVLDVNSKVLAIMEKFYSLGKNVYLVGNINNETYECLKKRFPKLNLFTDTMLSSNVKILKPDPEFFDKMILDWKLTPENCLFIDNGEKSILVEKSKKFNVVSI